MNQQDYQQIPPVKLRQQLTLVFQEPKLLGMTGKQAIAYPLHLRKLNALEIDQRLGQWTERLQIPGDWLDKSEIQLSLAQKQWIAIVRALVIQPQILLLDEATTALETGQLDRLCQTLNQDTHAPAITLITSRNLQLAQQLECNRLWHLHQGRLLRDQLSHEINWIEFQAQIQQAKQQAAEIWGED